MWIGGGVDFFFFTFVLGMRTARTLSVQALFVVGLIVAGLHAQSVGIGTATPHPSARLHISDNARGLLIPNVALSATNVAAPVTSPATSLLVYNTATAGTGATAVSPGFYYWDGSRWVRLLGGGEAWLLNGNAGTNPAVNFLGTTDAQPVVIRTNNTERMRVTETGNVGIGTTNLGIINTNAAHQFGLDPDDRVLVISNSSGSTLNLENTLPLDAANVGQRLGAVIFSNTSGQSDAHRQLTGIASYITGTAGSPIYTYTADLRFYTKPAGAPIERMRITGFGDVGIGTTSPINRLHVAGGDVRIGEINPLNTGSFPGYGRYLYFSGGPAGSTWDSDNSDLLWIARYNIASDKTELRVHIGDNCDDAFVVGTSGSSCAPPGERWDLFRVHTNGRVGIGTASPLEKLDVGNGNIAITNTDNTARQLRLYEPSGSGTNFTGFRAQAQASDIIYTLPASAPATSAAWLQSDNTGTMSWRPVFYGTVSVDPPSINANSSSTFTVSIAGVNVGDLVLLTPPSNMEADLVFQGADVTAGGTVTIRIRNVSGAVVDGAARTWKYIVIRP